MGAGRSKWLAGKESFICMHMILLPGLRAGKRPENAAAVDRGHLNTFGQSILKNLLKTGGWNFLFEQKNTKKGNGGPMGFVLSMRRTF